MVPTAADPRSGSQRRLEALFEAVKSRTDTVIDGRKIRLADLISRDDDHREVVKWMWSVLLADGTRALTRAGRWAEALRHAKSVGAAASSRSWWSSLRTSSIIGSSAGGSLVTVTANSPSY
jgi:hypothetical protein